VIYGWEQHARVTVNRGPIRKAKFLGNGLDTGPVDEFPLDLIAMLMSTDLAVPPMATEIDGPIRTFAHGKPSFLGIVQMIRAHIDFIMPDNSSECGNETFLKYFEFDGIARR
jgi:hypothetical protein